jgi:hypothetical protein
MKEAARTLKPKAVETSFPKRFVSSEALVAAATLKASHIKSTVAMKFRPSPILLELQRVHI